MRALIFVVIVLSLSGCKETDCPAFPSSLVDYFPYTNGDELKFMNTNNDTLILKIDKYWTSDSYSFDWNCKCSCEAEAGFDTNGTDKYSIKIQGRIHFYNESNTSILGCNFYDAQLSNDNFEIEKTIKNPYSDKFMESFGDTVVMERSDYNRFGSVTIIKGKGIVEFWDSKQNCNWMKI